MLLGRRRLKVAADRLNAARGNNPPWGEIAKVVGRAPFHKRAADAFSKKATSACMRTLHGTCHSTKRGKCAG
jgi:hypothetical protein